KKWRSNLCLLLMKRILFFSLWMLELV
ncbi:GTPase Der, partial [Haemophilus influenzae]